MKSALFALVSLVLGIAIGWVMTRAEFAGSVATANPAPATGRAAGTGKVTGPRAVVAGGESFNFGTMDRFATNSHEFIMSNEGDALLELTLGKTTCKCTLGSLKQNKLAPHESTPVRLEWAAKTIGEMFEQSAELSTNDPQHAVIHLMIHGRVLDALKPEETEWSLGEVSANETTTSRLRIFASKFENLTIEKHEWLRPETAEHFQISFEPLTKEGLPPQAVSGVAMLLSVKPGLPLGPLNQAIRVTTNLEKHEPLEIPIIGTVISDVSLLGMGVNPSRQSVSLGTLEHGAGIQRTVYLVVKGPYRDETKLQITGIEPQTDFQATLGEPLRDNPKIVRYPLLIEIPRSAAPGTHTADETCAHIRFSVTHPQVKELTVRVRYVVKE